MKINTKKESAERHTLLGRFWRTKSEAARKALRQAVEASIKAALGKANNDSLPELELERQGRGG